MHRAQSQPTACPPPVAPDRHRPPPRSQALEESDLHLNRPQRHLDDDDVSGCARPRTRSINLTHRRGVEEEGMMGVGGIVIAASRVYGVGLCFGAAALQARDELHRKKGKRLNTMRSGAALSINKMQPKHTHTWAEQAQVYLRIDRKQLRLMFVCFYSVCLVHSTIL